MLKESLQETLEASRLCMEYRKTDLKWGEFMCNGCLGYPAAILLFSIIDTIGSYYRKNSEFKAHIDGAKVAINSDGWEHFKILNTKYFKQNLSTSFIKALYTKFRSNLTHNSVLGSNIIMFMDEMNISPINYSSKAFATSTDKNHKTIFLVSIAELFKICKDAVYSFKNDIDTIVPNSKQGKSFR